MQKITGLVVRSRMALHWNQKQLGENLGWSYRTAARWESGASHFDPNLVTKLARHVYAVDRGLATELAATIGQTLLSLGLEAPPPPPVSPEPAPPPPAPAAPPVPYVHPTAPGDLVDAIVCSVADAANVAPRAVRPMVLLTLRRALALRLDLAVADEAGVFDGAASVSAKTPEPAVSQASAEGAA
jgi:DNA-binding XRE family transcriptional regulator